MSNPYYQVQSIDHNLDHGEGQIKVVVELTIELAVQRIENRFPSQWL